MQQTKKMKKAANSGFTLIEILVVIGMIALLAAIVIVAINPARQFAQGRDTQRTSNTSTILNAIGQRMADNKGKFDGVGIDGNDCPAIPLSTVTVPNPIEVGDEDTADQIGTSSDIDLSCLVPTYVSALPFDPNGTANDADTGYYVIQDKDTGRITVFSKSMEAPLNRTVKYISVTR